MENKKDTRAVFFQLLKNEISGLSSPIDLKFDCNVLYRIAKSHDLAHLIADSLKKASLSEIEENLRISFEKELQIVFFRSIKIEDLINVVSNIFNSNKIDFVLLKGAVIRNFYPETWMRTSCDVDLLIQENDIPRAISLLKENGFETDEKKGPHDISLFYGGAHLELHYNICFNMKQTDKLLKRVWEYTYKKSESEYVMTESFFVFYHLAHMSLHFIVGGCGVKPFIDLYLMREKGYINEEELMPLLKESNLVAFYKEVNNLIDVWFCNKDKDEFSILMEDYILRGGVYGTVDNNYAGMSSQKKGRLGYLFRLVFPTYSEMAWVYPKLRKNKLLLPYYYLARAMKKIFGKERKRIRQKAKDIMSQNGSKINTVGELLNKLEIKR